MTTKEKLILTISAAAVVLAGVVVYANRSKVGYIPSQHRPPTIASEPQQQTQNETAGWKSFRSDKYGFELKYPSDWTGGEYKQSGVYGEERGVSFSNPHKDNNNFIAFSIGEPGLGNLDEALSNGGEKFTETSFGNAVKFYVSGGRTDRGISEQFTIVQKDNLIYTLSFQVRKFDETVPYATPAQFTAEEKSIRDSMLSTFRFLDRVGWGKYQNDKYNFSIEYPSDWKLDVRESTYQSGEGLEYSLSKENSGSLSILPRGPYGMGRYEPGSMGSQKLFGSNVRIWTWFSKTVPSRADYYFLGPIPSSWVACGEELKNCSQINVVNGGNDLFAIYQILSTFKFTK